MGSENKETRSEIMSEIRVHPESHGYHRLWCVPGTDFSFIFILYLIKIKYPTSSGNGVQIQRTGSDQGPKLYPSLYLTLRSGKPKIWEKKIKLER